MVGSARAAGPLLAALPSVPRVAPKALPQPTRVSLAPKGFGFHPQIPVTPPMSGRGSSRNGATERGTHSARALSPAVEGGPPAWRPSAPVGQVFSSRTADFGDLASPSGCSPLAPPQVPLPPTCVGTFPPPPTPPPVGSRHSHSPRHPPEEAGPQEPAPGTKRQGPAGIGCQSQPSLLSRWWTPVLPTLSAWVPAAGTGCELLFPQGVLGGVAKPCHTQLTWDSARWPLAQPGRRFPGAGPVCQPHAGSCDPSSERNQSLGPSRSCPPGEGSGSKEPRYRASVTQGRVL